MHNIWSNCDGLTWAINEWFITRQSWEEGTHEKERPRSFKGPTGIPLVYYFWGVVTSYIQNATVGQPSWFILENQGLWKEKKQKQNLWNKIRNIHEVSYMPCRVLLISLSKLYKSCHFQRWILAISGIKRQRF